MFVKKESHQLTPKLLQGWGAFHILLAASFHHEVSSKATRSQQETTRSRTTTRSMRTFLNRMIFLNLYLIVFGLLAQTRYSRAFTRVIIVPGFLFGASKYEPLRKSLTEAGLDAVIAPIETWHWIPTLGGRSVRPILERIDWTVDWAMSSPEQPSDTMPWPAYSTADFLADFRNNPGGPFAVGGSTEPEDFPIDVAPRGTFWMDKTKKHRPFSSSVSLPPNTASNKEGQNRQVALIGHSAAGWISRLYLSSTPYGGRSYNGACNVAALVTLGTPHSETESIAFANVRTTRRVAAPQPSVPALAVGGKGYSGDGSAGAFTTNSYEFCGTSARECAEGADGDGVTPLSSAIDFAGAEKLILEGCLHAPDFGPRLVEPFVAPSLAKARDAGAPWYGDAPHLNRWLPWLKKRLGVGEATSRQEKLEEAKK